MNICLTTQGLYLFSASLAVLCLISSQLVLLLVDGHICVAQCSVTALHYLGNLAQIVKCFLLKENTESDTFLYISQISDFIYLFFLLKDTTLF